MSPVGGRQALAVKDMYHGANRLEDVVRASPGVLLRTGTIAGTVMVGPAFDGGAACSNIPLA